MTLATSPSKTKKSKTKATPQTIKQQLQAVIDALDSIDYASRDLPPHVRIARMQQRMVRLRRSLVAQVKVKVRLRRELKQLRGDRDE